MELCAKPFVKIKLLYKCLCLGRIILFELLSPVLLCMANKKSEICETKLGNSWFTLKKNKVQCFS